MPTPFPGMDPYLERPGLRKQVHTGLIVEMQTHLAAKLRPRYLVAIEQRTFLSLVVDLPMPDEIAERYLEVRDVESGLAITVIELLSPNNKLEDRGRYERKRLNILGSMTNLVEIDLLRTGRPLPMYGEFPNSHYRIVVSRGFDRPRGQVFPFNVQQPIPDIPIPLRPGEPEPTLPLNTILHELYDRAGYDLFVDYRQLPTPPLTDEEMAWVKQLVQEKQGPQT